MSTTTTKQEKQEQIEKLREWMPEGSTIYTILRYVSASGMMRCVSVVVFDKETGRPFHPNYSTAKAIGYKLTTKNGTDCLKIGGCGFDAGHDVVYALSHAIYGNGNTLRQEWL
jgi:hypothetical protein